MNIVISLRHFTNPGGTNNAMLGLAQGLKEHGVSVKVLCESKLQSEGVYDGVPYIKFKKKAGKCPFSVSEKLLNYIEDNKENIDLFLVNGCFLPYSYTISMSLIKLKIKYVFLPHDPYNEHIFNKKCYLKLPYFKFFEKKVIENAVAVQVLSSKHSKYIYQKTTQKQIVCLANGVSNEGETHTIDRARAKVRREIVKIIFLGRIDYYNKGLDLLLYSIKKLNTQLSGLHIEVVLQGSGDVLYLKKIVAKLELPNIKFKNSDFSKSSLELLSEYDFFILTSRFEGFSLAAAEAMLAGLPVVASEEAGIAEHVEKAKAGIMCKPNVESISVAITEMLDVKKEWQKMGERGRNYLLTNLTWNEIGKKAVIEYERILKDSFSL